MYNILYIEDDEKYATELINCLSRDDFNFTYLKNMIDLRNIKDFSKYDLILSDLYLNDSDTSELIRFLDSIDLPIIVISSSKDQRDELNVFTHNIQEYISKDSLMETIKLRMLKVLENSEVKEIYYTINGKKYFLIDDTNVVTDYDGDVFILTIREYKILRFLITNANVVINRQDLYYQAFFKHLDKSEQRVVDVYITRLRNKLGVYQIESVRGEGYKWVE